MAGETGEALANVTDGAETTNAEGQATEGSNREQATGNNQGLGWRAGLPADLRDKSEFTAMRTVGELGKSYLDAQSKLEHAIVPPGENARQDEIQAFRAKLGVPESPDGYEIDESGDKDFATEFRKAAHEQGLTPKQAKEVYGRLIEASRAFNERAKAQLESKREEGKKELQKEWGEQYEERDAAARRFALVSGNAFADALGDMGAFDDPRVIRGLNKLAMMISEDRLVEGRGQERVQNSGWEFPNTPGM